MAKTMHYNEHKIMQERRREEVLRRRTRKASLQRRLDRLQRLTEGTL